MCVFFSFSYLSLLVITVVNLFAPPPPDLFLFYSHKFSPSLKGKRGDDGSSGAKGYPGRQVQ